MAESKAKSKSSSSKKTETKVPAKTETKTSAKAEDKKPLIISICAAIVAIVVIIVVAIVINNKGLDDSYFVSDNSKYVLTIDTDSDTDEGEDGENYAPKKIHLVYTYSGDTVTSLKSYYEYPNADKAKAAFDYMKENNTDEEELAKYELNNKYIIYTSPEESYKDLKASDVEQQIKLMEENTGNSEEEVEVEESEETKIEDEE